MSRFLSLLTLYFVCISSTFVCKNATADVKLYKLADSSRLEHQQQQGITKLFSKEWLSDKTVKYGTVASLSLSQSISGAMEGHRWGGDGYLVNNNNYHVYRTARDLSWIVTGFFVQSTIRSPHLSGWGKCRRIAWAGLWAWSCFEWSYKYQRYGNALDNNPDHNQHALVWFEIHNGQIVDNYKGLGRITVPLVDILRIGLGGIIKK